MNEQATSFVPGHITAFFSAHPADDPAVAGSRGAGLALSHGVRVRVRPADERSVSLDGLSIEMPPVESVLEALGVEAHVEADSDLPLGTGFGVSGAMTLGTALAANAVFETRRTENDLVGLAHAAEVTAGTGLGDVVAQARGGVPLRLDPGGPAHGSLDGLPDRPRVEYVSFGELSTESVLSGDTTALTRAGEAALERLLESPDASTLLAESRRFAAEADLLTDRVADAIEAVTDAGGDAAMAMLGRTVFATGTGLTDAGYDARSCAVHPGGATLVTDD